MKIDLQRLPQSHDEHLWADYVELLCLADIDGEVSRSDVLDRVKDLMDISISDTTEDSQDIGQSTAQKSDRWMARSKDWYRHLSYRQSAFGASYPFMVDPAGPTLIRRTPMTQRRKAYVFLLLASSLGHIGRVKWNSISASFEYLSRNALKSYMPKSARVHVFGSNILNRSGKFSGLLWKKVKNLADELDERVLVKEAKFRPTDTGDHGLDVFGWVPIGDHQRGRLLVFAQCTSQLDWSSKQYQSSFDNWREIISLMSKPTNMIIIPYCFRDPAGQWFDELSIVDTVLVDRVRLIHLLEGKLRNLKKPTFDLVQEFLAYEEPIF